MNYSYPCQSCTCRYPIIPGDGPLSSPLLFVGERPGRNENLKGRPFIGDAGLEFNTHLLPLAGLDRDSIRITNTVKCWAEKNRKPTDKEISDCAGKYLAREIEEQDPQVVVLMGGTACSLCPEIDLERDHGIPKRAVLFGEERDVFPTYHPALGLHDTGKIRHLRDDFTALGRYLSGGSNHPADRYQGKERYSLYDGQSSVRGDGYGADTETVKGKLWSVQLSTMPGTGTLYLASEREHMREVSQVFSGGGRFYFHNAIHDIELLHKSGFDIPWGRVTDTMALAYHRGLPQGLKVLSYRLCGMEMQSYEDLVMPYSADVVLAWAVEAVEWVSMDHPKIGNRKNPIITELNRIAKKLAEGGDYNPWKRRRAVLEGDAKERKRIKLVQWWEKVEGKFGEMPVAGLDQVPVKQAVRYGCRDADAGLRVREALGKYRIG